MEPSKESYRLNFRFGVWFWSFVLLAANLAAFHVHFLLGSLVAILTLLAVERSN